MLAVMIFISLAPETGVLFTARLRVYSGVCAHDACVCVCCCPPCLCSSLLQGIKLNVQDPNQNVVLTKALDVEGKFAFTSAQGGEYQLCFATNSS